jgi:hypothetical protein
MGELRSRALGLALLLCLGLGAAASTAWADCATYLSSGEKQQPMSGTLLGTETVTESYTVSGGASAGTGSVSGGAGGSYTKSRTYDVGYYDFGGGVVRAFDCRTYTPYNE